MPFFAHKGVFDRRRRGLLEGYIAFKLSMNKKVLINFLPLGPKRILVRILGGSKSSNPEVTPTCMWLRVTEDTVFAWPCSFSPCIFLFNGRHACTALCNCEAKSTYCTFANSSLTLSPSGNCHEGEGWRCIGASLLLETWAPRIH